MDFYNAFQQIDKSKENIVITFITGENINSKLLLSDGKIICTNNENIDWKLIISFIPDNKKNQVITFNEERIFVEFIRQSYNVVVCGAGHISLSIIKLCKILDLPVTVIDDRLTFTNNAAKAGADSIICESFDVALNKLQSDKGTIFIIVTRGHRYDQTCLKNIIEKENAYIGMIGSKLRVKKVLDYLENEGVQREKLDAVYTPIGLKIGAETPAEIAVAIIAQIIEVKNKVMGSSTYNDELLNGIIDEEHMNIPKAVVTIVSRKGSAPREVGTKMVVLKNGTMIGTIGGGCVEAELSQKAFSCIENHKCELVKIDMTGSEVEDEGMVCGGIVEIFVEPIEFVNYKSVDKS